jgi:hypothetical protein
MWPVVDERDNLTALGTMSSVHNFVPVSTQRKKVTILVCSSRRIYMSLESS